MAQTAVYGDITYNARRRSSVVAQRFPLIAQGVCRVETLPTSSVRGVDLPLSLMRTVPPVSAALSTPDRAQSPSSP